MAANPEMPTPKPSFMYILSNSGVVGKFGNFKGEIIYNLARIPWIRDRMIEQAS